MLEFGLSIAGGEGICKHRDMRMVVIALANKVVLCCNRNVHVIGIPHLTGSVRCYCVLADLPE